MKRVSFKILFIVLTVILAGAAGLVIALTSRMADATATKDIKTAASEYTGLITTQAPPVIPEATHAALRTAGHPIATQAASPVNAEELGNLIECRELRRSFIIPSPNSVRVLEADTWESTEPEDYTELKGRAVSRTNEIAKELFGYEITDTNIDFKYYTDTSKNRADFVKVASKDNAVVCVFAADTLELIDIDYYLIPALFPKEALGFIEDNEVKSAAKIAALFGTNASDIEFMGGQYFAESFELTMENGKFAIFSTINDELYAVAVYPTKSCMTENVYFEADLQRDPSVVHLASPQNFVIGEPVEGDMTKDEALTIYGKFLDLANGEGDYPEPAATFYIDNSGTRENYWHLKGEKLTVDIASKSKWLVSLECGGLWNPEHDLTKVPYKSMGGDEYDEYVRNIMSCIYGDSLVEVKVNDIYSNNCTEDAVMADGTRYEFFFENRKLTKVLYYFDIYHIRYWDAGWKADHIYVNSITGEEFIPG